MEQAENTKRIISDSERGAHEAFISLSKAANELIIGQHRLMERLLIALLSNGHLLVEGAPGLAKTTAIKVIAERIEGDFHRIQFTPDLLPADLTGTEIYRPQEGSFEFQQGPIFHNLILADEVNRAPAKVQSALLEAMGEHQVTVGRVTYRLPPLFLVMATQNPIEQEGTYPLPEAQLDRFLMHVSITYPDAVQCEHTRPKVVVRRHSVDWDDPVQPTVERAMALLRKSPAQCVYVTPAVTVLCPEPTDEFFREVRKRQAEWCRQSSRTIPRRVRRRVSQWVGGGIQFSSKAERYLHRAFCYTGVLFINGELVHPSQWG